MDRRIHPAGLFSYAAIKNDVRKYAVLRGRLIGFHSFPALIPEIHGISDLRLMQYGLKVIAEDGIVHQDAVRRSQCIFKISDNGGHIRPEHKTLRALFPPHPASGGYQAPNTANSPAHVAEVCVRV